MTGEPGGERGRVIITWPAARESDHAMMTMGGRIHDADTGDELTGVFQATLRLGSEIGFSAEPMTVELIEIADDDGNPVRGKSWMPIMTEEYKAHREQLRATGLDGPLDAAQLEDLLAREAEFAGQQVRTVTSRYLVAGMRIAGDER